MPHNINFIKMHGLGNDFVLLDSRNDPTLASLPPETISRITDRHYGVGCDQIVILANNDTADIAMTIINADGSIAETCGNAARCVALLIKEEKNKKQLTIASHHQLLPATILADNKISIGMGSGVYDWDKIPLAKKCDTMQLPLDDLLTKYAITPLAPPLAINVGNPHCLLWVENADKIAIEKIGYAIEHHALFPQRTNVEFLSQSNADNQFRLRVWERGSGATLACGSGAVAGFLALQRLKKLSPTATATMLMDGGILSLALKNNSVIMTGPAELVYKGTIKI
ncbi:MAG: diaminopimelate epimerase [Alphaproteobacteria bacterium]